jgi:predicted acyl esterase
LKTTGAAMQGVWQDATNWLDHYVRGTDNGIQQQDPVRLRDVITNAWNGYPSWDAVGSATAQSLGLAQSFGTIGTGGAPWSRTLLTGVATVADAGPSEIGLSHFLPPTTPKLADIDPNDGLVFGGDALTSAREVSGVPQVHLTVHSSGSTATFFVYLYDVGKLGAARLMTFAPYTVTGANADKSVTVALRPIAWTMSKGDRLAIVIDTVDDRYLSSNAPGSTVTFSSSAADPATASIPFAG